METRTSRRTLCTLAATFALLLAATASAQLKGSTPIADDMTDAQHKQVLQLLARTDAQIEQAAKKHAGQVEQMRAELKKIEAMSAAQQAQAIAAYQVKHRAFYQQLLREANVDLNRVAAELNRVLPQHAYQPQKDLALVATFSQSTAVPATPTPEDRVLAVSGFTADTARSCSLVSGSTNRAQRSTVSSSTAAATAGGCSGRATLATTLTDTTSARAVFTSGRRTYLSTTAVAVAGAAVAETNVVIQAGSQPALQQRLAVMAPLLWTVSRDSNSEDPVSATQANPPANLAVRFEIRTRVVSVLPSFSNASGFVTLNSPEVRLQF